MDDFLFNFYNIINGIINYIRKTDIFKENLNDCNYCNYKSNNKDNIKDNSTKLPIIFCLGGMAYKIYEKIIQEQNIDIKLDSDTLDFDFSFSLKNKNEIVIQQLKTELKEIFNKLIKDYTYIFDEVTVKKYNLLFTTINETNFEFSSKEKFDRLHITINCDIMKNLHILELSFWYNNKAGDNFFINDFEKNKLFIYNNNKLNYYLLPLNLLVKTTFSAIFDYLERRNYDKCNKYVQRIKFIKNCHNEYIKNKSNLVLKYIFEYYDHDIRKKYKIINDYPFILAEQSQNIERSNRSYLTRCIHTDFRNNNILNIEKQFDDYLKVCKIKVNKKTIDKYTEEH